MEENKIDLSNIKSHINRLKESPIYCMSLGSKELFHSNFWAYLMNNNEYKRLINLFFPTLRIEDVAFPVTRENKNRDIVITSKDGREYIIENKIKSYPDLEQLIRYSTDSLVEGVVTGINKPPFELPVKWRFISYRDVAQYLRNISSSGFLHDVVSEYCNNLDSINFLLEFAMKETEGYLTFWSETTESYNEIGLRDVYRKLKADDFIRNGFGKLKDKYEEAAIKHNWIFKIERGFNHCKPTINFIFYSQNNNKSIGVQIEQHDFRIFAKRDGLSAKENFNLFSELGWFENGYDKNTNPTIRGYGSKMKNLFDKYGNDWPYQYFNLWTDDKSFRSYSNVTELLKKELDRAVEIIAMLDK